MEIRDETPFDIEAIDALTIDAFEHAPHSSHTEHLIVRALREAGELSLSLVAVDGEDVIGHVAISPVAVSDGTGRWFGLGPISVRPARQGTGIGSALVRSALARLREGSAAGCVVLGDPAFYTRFGFAPEPQLILPDVPPEYFQATSFGTPTPDGIVSYHEAFGARG